MENWLVDLVIISGTQPRLDTVWPTWMYRPLFLHTGLFGPSSYIRPIFCFGALSAVSRFKGEHADVPPAHWIPSSLDPRFIGPQAHWIPGSLDPPAHWSLRRSN